MNEITIIEDRWLAIYSTQEDPSQVQIGVTSELNKPPVKWVSAFFDLDEDNRRIFKVLLSDLKKKPGKSVCIVYIKINGGIERKVGSATF